MDTISAVISLSLTPLKIAYVSLGLFIGYIVGAIPGMGKAAAIAIPLTYSMAPVSAIGFLVGIAKGSTAGERGFGNPDHQTGRTVLGTDGA